MIEIVSLVVLLGVIGNMARRRGRSPSIFGLILLACWFGGELSGGAAGLVLLRMFGGDGPILLLVYGLALLGAIAGAGVAFFFAASSSPVDGIWRDGTTTEVRGSRLCGVLAGSLFGGALGAALTWFMYGEASFDSKVPIVIQGFLAVGLIGGLLGLVSGLQPESDQTAPKTNHTKA